MHDYFPRYEPKSAFGKWLDDRLPATRLMYDSFVAYPVPRNLNYWYTFGGILAFMLAVQIVTGVVLAMHYVASADLAFESVEKIMRDVNYGWLLRYIHSNGASMFFLAAYVHIFRGLYYGSYKAPREVLWILGVIILLLMMATAFMGYVLPWGQMSFWGATVITNLFSAIPLIGESITTWLWGGFAVGDADAEPLLLAALSAAVHDRRRGGAACLGAARQRADQSDRRGGEVEAGRGAVHAARDDEGRLLDGALRHPLRLVRLLYPELSWARRQLHTRPIRCRRRRHIVPEWYLLPFYAILRGIPNKLLGVVVMFSSIGVLFLVPWLDTSRVRSAVYRPLYKQFFWILVARGDRARLSRLEAAGRRLCDRGAHPDRLLLHPLPRADAAARPLRDAAAAAGFDLRGGAAARGRRRRASGGERRRA